MKFVRAIVGMIAGLFGGAARPPSKRLIKLDPIDVAPEARPEFRRHRSGDGHGWTRRLRAKFANNALERYGLDTTVVAAKDSDGNVIRIPDPENRRVLRNARKQERQAAR